GCFDDLADVLEDGLVVAGLHGPDVHHHVDFAGAVANGIACLVGLGTRAHGSQRKTDHAADHDIRAREQRLGEADPGGVDAHRCEAMLAGFVAQAHDVFALGVSFEQGVIDHAGEAAIDFADARWRADASRTGLLDGSHRPGPAHDAGTTGRAVFIFVADAVAFAARLHDRQAAAKASAHALGNDVDELIDLARLNGHIRETIPFGRGALLAERDEIGDWPTELGLDDQSKAHILVRTRSALGCFAIGESDALLRLRA